MGIMLDILSLQYLGRVHSFHYGLHQLVYHATVLSCNGKVPFLARLGMFALG